MIAIAKEATLEEVVYMQRTKNRPLWNTSNTTFISGVLITRRKLIVPAY